MTQRRSVCQRYPHQESWAGNTLGRYFAAVECDPLPRPLHREDHGITHGCAVAAGHWYFFPAPEPAVVFGRAARMSPDSSYDGVFEAAVETMFCNRHDGDETALLVNTRTGRLHGGGPDNDHERALMQRFFEGVQQHPSSAHWHPPTGPGTS